MSDWIGIIIAGLALGLSIFTWTVQHRRQAALERRADVSVYFHWLSSRARVAIPGREDVLAGYHLVLVNRGPAAAEQVSLTIEDTDGRPLKLLDLYPNELPLTVLDVNGRYPIPFVYEPFTPGARRFQVALTWSDGDGPHTRIVPLRRGELPS